METIDGSSTVTSSTESDCNSVQSVIVHRAQLQQQNDETDGEFTLPTPRSIPLGSYAIASCVYVLIDEDRSMSADMRVMWFLKRLGTIQMVDDDLVAESSEQCKIMSFIPRQENLMNNRYENSVFVMNAHTRVYFLTAVYSMVYCLDMSPSNCSVDIQRGHVMLDEMIIAMTRSIEGFIRPFIVPGSNKIVFEPQVYVTVIVHTPFYSSLAQQVLVQGWLINNRNFNEFIQTVTLEMNNLENSLAKTKIIIRKTKKLNDESISGNEDGSTGYKKQNQKLDDNIMNIKNIINDIKQPNNVSNNDENSTSVSNNNPDSGFINTLRYGMLAVRLLPQTSISNLIVITDGMITLADIQVLDSVLNQLRCIGVACSFLHVSSQFHPHSSHGNVPYAELMQLIATATSGTYLNAFPRTIQNLDVNYYHDKFIMWSFKRDDANGSPNTTNLSCTPPKVRYGEWTVRNSSFYGNRQTQLVSKRQISDHVQAHLDNIVCCRMREGFIIEDIQFKDVGNATTVLNMSNTSKLQLKFILPWTNHIYIEYDVIVKWPPPIITKAAPEVVQKTPEIQIPSTATTQPTQAPVPSQPDGSLNIHYTIVVKGPYEFLHDITCGTNKKYIQLSKLSRQCQFQLSSYRSSSIAVTAATTTITKNTNLIPDRSSSQKVVTSKYRQALIARFWSTMHSIVQTDLLVKHLETYSPSTGHLNDDNNSNQSSPQSKNLDRQQPLKQESPVTPQIQQSDDSKISTTNLNNSNTKTDTPIVIGKKEAKSVNFSSSGVPNRSPLRSGMPLFYHLPINSNTSFSVKQNQVKLNDQQQSYTDQQHQQFADFWKPVCTLDPDSQWPKWFSTYRIGDGVLLLRHDRPLPRWLHMANTNNGRYQTLTCRKAAESLFALLKQWCTFVLIDDHSYVKCLDKSDTHNDNVSFCIARVSLRPPSCCCVVLHLAFQSSVPASVHNQIIDNLKKRIQLLDSTTAVKSLSSSENKQLLVSDNKKKIKTKKKKEIEQLLIKKKSMRPQRYVYLLDKPLEKILIRYERIPSEFTTVIFPDGSQPCPTVTTSNSEQQDTSQESLHGIELSAVTTTTTLSRYLYHRRWIWSSGCNSYSKLNSSESQKLQFQLARTLSVLTKIRLREGFKFAHSSAGIINMVLQVDMIEGSPYCPSTPTSHCIIQYVLFPPNILNKHRQKDQEYSSVVDILKKKNDDEKSSTSSIEDQQLVDIHQKQENNVINLETSGNNYCCPQRNTDDDYQLITECWIEPQHGSVVVNKKQNINYMSGLKYEQLADAICQVDSDCISSLYTFHHMHQLCVDPNISVYKLDIDFDQNQQQNQQQNKTIIIDDGRIYKSPFTFSLISLLPKCRHHSSLTFSLFTTSDDTDSADLNSTKDEKKLNNMLERSFYSRLRTINNRSFDVSDSNTLENMNQVITKVNDQDIGQCFIKRVNDTRLILTVAPSFVEDKSNIIDNSSQDNLQPLSRSRANTWHYSKTNGQSVLSLSAQPQDQSMHYYRTMSVGSKPYYKDTNDMPWAQHRLESNFCTPESNDCPASCSSDISENQQECPTSMCVEVYDCRQEDVENVLMSDSNTFDDTVINDYIDDSSSCSSISTNSDEDEEENLFISSRKKIVFDEPVDPMVLDKYFNKIQIVYDRSLVTTVFHALHLGLNVQYLDIQRAVDRCQHRLITFDITDYLKVVCDHFKENSNYSSICPADNKTLKTHHNMIHSTFSSTLDRHMLRPVASHPDYYFYDFIDNLDGDDHQDNYYMRNKISSSSGKNYLTNILMGEHFNKTHFDIPEIDEQDIFPLFVHLVCTVKTNTMTKSQSVRSLPTCILELLNQDDQNNSARKINVTNLKVSLDVYCLMLPNNDYDYDDDEDGNDDRFNSKNNSELHFQIINNSNTQLVKQTEDYENPFVFLSSSLPLRHAQGLAAFIAEVEWCMRDEMAAGLLKDPNVTPDTLEKIIEHVINSPHSSSNDYQQIPVHIVVPSPGPSKYNSISIFLQKLDQLDIILDNGGDDGGLYTLEKSTNNTFYVVEKNTQLSPDSTASENMINEDSDMYCDSKDLPSNTECKSMLPNFWIILKIQGDQQCQKENKSDNNNAVNTILVNLYFHCRFTELDVQGRYSAVKEIVEQNVRQAATIVNQTLLLCRLHDTRVCDPLLEPELVIEDIIHSDDDDDGNGDVEKVINHFTLGQFRCPVVWSTRFSLHPRLQHSISMLLLGVQVLHSVLDKFSVRNRRNMFVYKESTGSVFYLRLYENSSQQQNHKNNVGDTLQYDSDDEDSISRCSSATSTTATVSSSVFPSNHSNFSRKYSEEFNYMENKPIQTPGTRSLGGYWGDTESKDVEDVTLKVHGISPVGNEIRIDLVEVLQNRLNDAVLEVLTTMLYRNPVCRLYPDDVRYVQPYDGPPDYTMKLSLPIETKITRMFVHNLKRNAAALLLYPPKYASRYHRFNYVYDTSDNSEKPIIRSFFMYNQPSAGTSGTGGIRVTSGNRGLACVLFDIYSNEDSNSLDNSYDYPVNIKSFTRRIQAICIKDNIKSVADYSGYMKIFVWRRGRVNMEALQIKLTSAVTCSLWDIYIEQFLWEQPIIIEQPSETHVNPLCIQYLAKWIAFGARISAPLARHSQIQCRIHINHVLRELKTHLSWFGTSTSNNLCISVRYFYIPRTQYGQSQTGDISSNIISGSTDPLQLEQKQNPLMDNLMFYEWKISNTNSVICPPSAACVLIIVSVISMKRIKQKRKRHQNQSKDNELSDSDTDNSFVVPEDEENTNSEEGNTKTLVSNDQALSNSTNDNVKQNTMANNKRCQKQRNKNNCNNKITKLLMLAVSEQSVHTLSYNCHNDNDQSIAIHRLSRWLEWRRTAFISFIYHMMGLKTSQTYGQCSGTRINSHSSRTNNNLDLLLEYKSYVSAVGEHELVKHNKVTIEKNNRPPNNRTKPIDNNDIDDKKKKPIQYNKDVHDLYIEQLVRNSKQQRRIETYQKMLFDLWIQEDAIITKEAFRAFYHHSRLLHYCLTPLLFLPLWRLELAATREHLVDAAKTRSISSPPPPQWHKRLCARLTSAYARYIETNILFNGFQAVQISKSRVPSNDGATMEFEYTQPTTCYFKKSVPGATGGLLLIETGVCQPYYYVKLCGVERARITNQVEYYENKNKPQYSLLDHSENIIQNMHLHSFTYDFHVRVLSDRLNQLVQKQKTGKGHNYGHDLSMLLENRSSAQSSGNKSGSSNKKNAIAGFLDDFLKYYLVPPLYSSCLVLSGVIKRTQIPVSGLQLYEYLLENCSEDCDGMAVIKICDSSLVDGDDGASLFDDNDDDDEDNKFIESQSSSGTDLTDFILVHHMAGSDIQRRQELQMSSNCNSLGAESKKMDIDGEFEVCGLYDATLVMTLSSVKKLLLDTSNEINLSYYVLLTNNENDNLEKKEINSSVTNYIMQQRHSTPIRPPVRGFDQPNLLSASVPSNSFGNVIGGSAACWGSLDENNTNNWPQTTANSPHLKKKLKKNHDRFNDLNDHHQQIIKKTNLIKFYEKKAAELVAHTVDTAANRCRIHLLWQIFSLPFDQQKLGSTGVTFEELEELVNKSGLVKPLSVYDKRLGPLIEELCKGPQWFTSIHKLIIGHTPLSSPSTYSPRCRIYNSNKSEHQYLVVLPNRSDNAEFNAFIIIDNGIDSTENIVASSDSLINIVFRRNVSGSEEINTLVETVGKAICYHIWRSVATATATFTAAARTST